MTFDRIQSIKRDRVRHLTSAVVHRNQVPRTEIDDNAYDKACEDEFVSTYISEYTKVSQAVLDTVTGAVDGPRPVFTLEPDELAQLKNTAYVDWLVDLIETNHTLSSKSHLAYIETVAFAVDIISLLSPFQLTPVGGELRLTLDEQRDFKPCAYVLSLLELPSIDLLTLINNLIESSKDATRESQDNWNHTIELKYGKERLEVDGATCKHVHACISKYRGQ